MLQNFRIDECRSVEAKSHLYIAANRTFPLYKDGSSSFHFCTTDRAQKYETDDFYVRLTQLHTDNTSLFSQYM